MTIQISLDEQLLQEAMKYAPVKTQHELVDLALREYITHHIRPDIRDLKVQIKFYEGYDHKALREPENE
jgi:Arc/MetJ family transcription regulator